MSLSPRPLMFNTSRLSRGSVGASFDDMGQRVGRLQRGDDPLKPGAELERVQRLLVGGRGVGHAAGVAQPRVLGADAGIIEPGRDGVAFEDLSVVVLKQIGAVAVEHARTAAVHRSRVAVGDVEPVARRLDAVDLHAGVVQERMEQADGVGAAADAGHQRIGKTAFALQHLLAGFVADHRLEVAHHGRVRVRTGRRADQIVGGVDVGDPVAQGLVHGVLEGAQARCHRPDLGAEQLHAEYVGLLPLDVRGAHVDHAGQAVAGRHGGRGHAMLTGARLGDDALLAHAPRQEDLAKAVVHLVGAGVVQLLALEIDLGAAEMLGQPLGEIERDWDGPRSGRSARPVRP